MDNLSLISRLSQLKLKKLTDYGKVFWLLKSLFNLLASSITCFKIMVKQEKLKIKIA